MSAPLRPSEPVGEGHTWGEAEPGQTFRLPDGTSMTVLKALKHHMVIPSDYLACTDPELLSIEVSEGKVRRHFRLNPSAVLDPKATAA